MEPPIFHAGYIYSVQKFFAYHSPLGQLFLFERVQGRTLGHPTLVFYFNHRHFVFVPPVRKKKRKFYLLSSLNPSDRVRNKAWSLAVLVQSLTDSFRRRLVLRGCVYHFAFWYRDGSLTCAPHWLSPGRLFPFGRVAIDPSSTHEYETKLRWVKRQSLLDPSFSQRNQSKVDASFGRG